MGVEREGRAIFVCKRTVKSVKKVGYGLILCIRPSVAFNLIVVFCHSVMSDSLRPCGLHAACQCSLSFTISQSLLKLMSTDAIGDAIQSSHTLSPPSLALNLSQHQGLFQ